jgi:hypothetical protein
MVTLEALQNLYKQAQTEWTTGRKEEEKLYVEMVREVTFSALPQPLQDFLRQTQVNEQQKVTLTFSHLQANVQEPPTIYFGETYSFFVEWKPVETSSEKEAEIDKLNIHLTVSATGDLEITASLGSSMSNARSNYQTEALLDTDEAELFIHLEEELKNPLLQDTLIQGLVPLFEPSLV